MKIITGASSGIGKVMYEYFKGRGENVVGISRGGPDYYWDLSRIQDTPCFLEYSSLQGQVDLLINNAGMMLLDESDFGKCMEMVSVNLIAVWRLSEELFRLGRFYKDACIVNIASISGIRGDSDVPLYSATKAGVIALTKAHAKKFAPIRVNCISPGLFKTNLVPGDTPQELIDTTLLKREAGVQEIIPALQMILDSKYMTGSNIVVDGGALRC